ncbi:MAG: hypothetical protein ABF296_11475 [Oceanococcaceae bacterium]|jgi:hypothetical protein
MSIDTPLLHAALGIAIVYLLANILDVLRKIAKDLATIRWIKDNGPEVEHAKRVLDAELRLGPGGD